MLGVVAISLVAFWIGSFSAVLFSCHPIHIFWDEFIPPDKCTNFWNVLWGIAGPNIATDIVLLILPLPILWKLQMRLSKKIAIMSMFAIGSL